jgi:hypothetical protein
MFASHFGINQYGSAADKTILCIGLGFRGIDQQSDIFPAIGAGYLLFMEMHCGLLKRRQWMVLSSPGADKERLNHIGGNVFNMRGLPYWTVVFVDSQRANALYGFTAVT